MITTINGVDTITTLPNGQFRAHRQAAWWIGDYTSFADAERALQIANHPAADANQRGIYDGGAGADEQTHLAAVTNELFGAENCVTEDAVRRTILPGEAIKLVGGWPVRA
jgi:hypothetical protein